MGNLNQWLSIFIIVTDFVWMIFVVTAIFILFRRTRQLLHALSSVADAIDTVTNEMMKDRKKAAITHDLAKVCNAKIDKTCDAFDDRFDWLRAETRKADEHLLGKIEAINTALLNMQHFSKAPARDQAIKV